MTFYGVSFVNEFFFLSKNTNKSDIIRKFHAVMTWPKQELKMEVELFNKYNILINANNFLDILQFFIQRGIKF